MDKKVYYGEYTLKHWVELLLRKDVVLPPYQRSFVWPVEAVKGFVRGIQDDGFVPPVTIGVCNVNGHNVNLILDGQQRLSSILLSYFGVYPKKDVFLRPAEQLALANGQEEDGDADEPEMEVINWSLRMFADNGPSEIAVQNAITDAQYDRVGYDVDDDFFEKHYLGFSFIIPNAADEAEQHEFYSTVFRSINILGVPLDPIESRKSLYFLKTELIDFFEPDCCKNIKIELTARKLSYDFVRAMSLLSQYRKDGRVNRLAQGYKPRMEKYYEEYIYAVVKDEPDGMFAQFSAIFPNGDYAPRLERLRENLLNLGYANLHFTSIIDADVYMLGLIYLTVFNDRDVDIAQSETLMHLLRGKVNSFRRDDSHKGTPSLLKHIRNRVETSITLFNRYAVRRPAH